MKVTILGDSHRVVPSTKSGKLVNHHMQEIFVRWSHEPFPRPTTIYLGSEDKPDSLKPAYTAGEYEFDIENSLEIRNERLTVSDIVLKPIKHAPPSAAGGAK